jgi:DHA2 family multidrug resistance protein
MTLNPQSPQNVKAYYFMLGGLFMAILDIQIVASSLSEIQGALCVSLDEISWIQTTYLIAEVIMIPICGWLARAFSTRILFSVASGLFTFFSMLCIFAWNLESMIFFRTLQGFFGGAMIPTVFASSYVIFPPEKQSRAIILAGLMATLAPTLGPTLGGWLTTHFSWQWLFLINVIPGLVITYNTFHRLSIDLPQKALLKKFDLLGFLSMALGLGLLEVFLKEGHKNDWFDSIYITGLFICLTGFLTFFVYRQLNIKNPLVDLRAFGNLNFSIGCFLSFTVGVALFGSVFLLPMMLITVKHYNSLQIGFVMCVAGVFQFLSGPIAGNLEKKMPARFMLLIGISMFGIGMIMNSAMTTEVDIGDLFLPQCIRGLSIMMCFLPMTTVTFGTLPTHEIKNASGLYNLMRNLGGAIGIAVIQTVLDIRVKTHQSFLSEKMNALHISQVNGEASVSFLDSFFTDPNHLEKISYVFLKNRIEKQVLIQAFNDVFLYVGCYLLLCCLLVFLIREKN